MNSLLTYEAELNDLARQKKFIPRQKVRKICPFPYNLLSLPRKSLSVNGYSLGESP